MGVMLNVSNGLSIFYRVTEIRENMGRVDYFIRCAGLTREACLAYYADSDSVRQHYQRWVIDSKASPVVLRIQDMKHEEPELYEHIKSVLNGTPREPFELTAGTMMPLVSYASRYDDSLRPVVESFQATLDLAGLRNTYAHTIQETKKNDVQKVSNLFVKLRSLLPKQEYQVLTECDPFRACTEIITDALRFCDK